MMPRMCWGMLLKTSVPWAFFLNSCYTVCNKRRRYNRVGMGNLILCLVQLGLRESRLWGFSVMWDD